MTEFVHFFLSLSVCLRWRLHFEFVTVVNDVLHTEKSVIPEGCTMWQGSPTLDVETMVWDLPIKVFPTSPLHAWSATVLRGEDYKQV